MRLYKCPKVERYLKENELIDVRKIWCYAQMKSKIVIKIDPVTIYGLVLVCVNHDTFFLYFAEFNKTDLKLVYECKLSEMENVCVKKILFGLRTKLSFSKGKESFELEMDDWKRFSEIFEKN